MIRVFLLDDHEVVRAGVRNLLERDGDVQVVGEASTATAALARIPEVMPHVAILDGRVPDGSGIEVCRQIRSEQPEIATLILTSYDDDEALLSAIMAGASGYVLKQISGQELVAAVHRVARGGSLFDPRAKARATERLREGSPEEPDEVKQLTPQERRILGLVAEGLTNRQIGTQLHLAEKTVKNYMSNILAKLGFERRTQAAVFAVRLLGESGPGSSATGDGGSADQGSSEVPPGWRND